MSYSIWLASAVAALLPLAAAAQASVPADPADPQVAVVAVPIYRSAFADYRSTGDETDAPDQGHQANGRKGMQ